jgi:penicillin-binding protein 1B
MAQRQLITPVQARAEQLKPLNVRGRGAGQTRFPAFIDLVRQQLQMDYKPEDLQTEGLRIFTTLDPHTQLAAERAVADRLARTERARRLATGVLQAAVVVVDTANGEILGLVGDRQARYNGFNRALSAQRQIGSLVKPSIYLTALSQPDRYHLASLLDDSPFSLELPNGQSWRPQNYDHASHGQMPLFLALAQSNNLASVRLGIDVGIGKVIQTLKQLGLEQTPNAYPSLLLGAINLTPLQVAQIYEPVAAGGFGSRLRAIREVMTQAGVPLQHYALNMNQSVDPKFNYLLVRAMQEVVREGTASGLNAQLPPSLNIAAKTGTTNDYRDSWFAVFTGDRLAVVWVGRDDNKPTGLSGASGAMPIWAGLMRELNPQPLNPEPPEGIVMQWVDRDSGLLSAAGCPGAIELPVVAHSGPPQSSPCAQPQEDSHNPIDWVKQWFQ